MSKKCKDCNAEYAEVNDCCPECGSVDCYILVCDSIGFKEFIRGEKLDESIPGKKKKKVTGNFQYGYKSSADLMRHPQGITISRNIDKTDDTYDEVVTDNLTGCITNECHEPLSEHRGHGSAGKRSQFK